MPENTCYKKLEAALKKKKKAWCFIHQRIGDHQNTEGSGSPCPVTRQVLSARNCPWQSLPPQPGGTNPLQPSEQQLLLRAALRATRPSRTTLCKARTADQLYLGKHTGNHASSRLAAPLTIN